MLASLHPVLGAALVSGAFTVVVAVIQLRVQKSNRRDHGVVATRLSELHDTVATTRTTVLEVREDVRDVRDRVVNHETRIDELERNHDA